MIQVGIEGREGETNRAVAQVVAEARLVSRAEPNRKWLPLERDALEALSAMYMADPRTPGEIISAAVREYYAMHYAYPPQKMVRVRDEVINNKHWVDAPLLRFDPAALAPGNPKSVCVIPYDNSEAGTCGTLVWNRIWVAIDRALRCGTVGQAAKFTVELVRDGASAYEVRRLR